MSRTTRKALTVEPKVTIEFNEGEMRALEALTGYGIDDFIEFFYKHMGKHYLQPHEKDLRTVFETFRKEFIPILSTTDTARKILERELK